MNSCEAKQKAQSHTRKDRECLIPSKIKKAASVMDTALKGRYTLTSCHHDGWMEKLKSGNRSVAHQIPNLNAEKAGDIG